MQKTVDISRNVEVSDLAGANINNGDAIMDHLKERCLVAREATEELKMRDLVSVIHEQHCQIMRLSDDAQTISVRVEDARKRVKEISNHLDRCTEASDALWNKNKEKEQRNARLREKLRTLRMLHNPDSDHKKTASK